MSEQNVLTLADYDERRGIYKTKIKNYTLQKLAVSRQFDNLNIKEVSDKFDAFYDELIALNDSRKS